MTDNNITHKKNRRLRWSWFPSLFFGDGMVVSVLLLSMVMLHRFGVGNTLATIYLSLMCLPFMLRPLLEMAVAHFKGTTKVWILSAGFISALSLWAIAFILPTNYWLQGTICLMPFVMVFGTLYNIAMERFYVDIPSASYTRQSKFALLFRCISLLFGIGAVTMLAGNMEVVTRNVRYSWSVVFYLMAGIEFFMWLWHSIFLPSQKQKELSETDTFGLNGTDYNAAIDSLTQGWRNRFKLYFFMLFILPEAIMAFMQPLFLIDAPHNGGLGLSPQEYGLTFGTIAVIAVGAGSMAGSYAINRLGLTRCIIPASIILMAHGATMLYLSNNIAAQLTVTSLVLFAGNMSFGIGLAACTSIVNRFAAAIKGHIFRRAVALSLMWTTVIATNIFCGMLQENIGYRQFFLIVMATYIVTIISASIYAYIFRKAV